MRLGAPDQERAAVQSVLILAGVMFVIGAALSAGAVNIAMVVLGRLVLGLGVGGGTTARSRAWLCLVCLMYFAWRSGLAVLVCAYLKPL